MTSTPFLGSTSIGPTGSTSFSHTAHYTYIDGALKQQWRLFSALKAEMQAFVPKPVSAWDSYRAAETARMHALNPDKSNEEMAAFVDRQVAFATSPAWQFRERFDSRHMSEYVTVLMLAHALSEALVNAVLAIGLAHVGAVDLFHLLERADLKQKWLFGPKAFSPTYTFPVGTALHEALVCLVKQRNALVHHKIELQFNGAKVLEGSNFQRQSYEAEQRWIERFFSLPYDLAGYVREAVPTLPMMLLLDPSPIPRAASRDAALYLPNEGP